MVSPEKKCPNCKAPIGYRNVALGLYPPRVACPRCGTPLVSFGFAKLPPLPFLFTSLGLGLAIGVVIGTAITFLSRDWSYSYRFVLIAVALVGGALVIRFSRSLVPRDKDVE